MQAQATPVEVNQRHPSRDQNSVSAPTSQPRHARSVTDDAGFSILESVVAMFLLLIVAVSILPILTQSMTLSVRDAGLVTATSLANQAIEDLRVQTTCGGVTALDQSTLARPNLTLRTVRTKGACPTAFPGTMSVTVTVTDAATGAVQISANTLVFVTGA